MGQILGGRLYHCGSSGQYWFSIAVNRRVVRRRSAMQHDPGKRQLKWFAGVCGWLKGRRSASAASAMHRPSGQPLPPSWEPAFPGAADLHDRSPRTLWRRFQRTSPTAAGGAGSGRWWACARFVGRYCCVLLPHAPDRHWHTQRCGRERKCFVYGYCTRDDHYHTGIILHYHLHLRQRHDKRRRGGLAYAATTLSSASPCAL